MEIQNLLIINKMNKKLCPIHRLYFKGVECPFCLSERLKKFEEKHQSTDNKAVNKRDKSKEVTEDMLNKLKAKFSSI